jgi:hypothetical protein
LTNNLIRVQQDHSEVLDVSSSFNVPSPRDQHTSLFYGNKLIIFGGTGPVTGTLYRSNELIANDVWMFKVGPVCQNNQQQITGCYKCGPGTYEYRSQCLSCAKGYYNDVPDATSCKPCPKGFQGLQSGATSLAFCYPCEHGFYNDESGMIACKPCPSDNVCPMGSIAPLEKEYVEQFLSDSVLNVVQPSSRADYTARNKWIGRYAFIGAGAVSAVLLVIWLITRKCMKKVYTYMDVLFDDNHNIHQGPMVRKRNSFGGIASVVSLLFIVSMSINIIVPVATDNLLETRSLIPNLKLIDVNVTAHITASVTLLDYFGECTTFSNGTECPSKIRAYTSSGLVSQNETYTCHESVNATLPIFTRNCTITFSCIDCKFTASGGSIIFDARQSQTYTKGFEWSIEATSGYPNQNSSISSIVRSSDNSLFRGILQYSVANIAAIQSVYRNTVDRKSYTGVHFDFASLTPGDTVDSQSFNYKNGVGFRFDLQRSVSSLEVILSQKKSWIDVIGALLGGIAGLVGLAGKIVQQLEKTNARFLKYSKKAVLATTREHESVDDPAVTHRRTSKLRRKQKLVSDDGRRDRLMEMPDLPNEPTTQYSRLVDERTTTDDFHL